MRRNLIVCAFVATLACLTSAAVAKALMIAPAPIPNRVATAEVIVVGKVVQLEAKSVTTTRYPGQKDKVDHAIAVVEIADGILVAKDMKKVRIGFVLPPPVVPPNPGAPVIGGGRDRFPQLNHQVGQEALYMLKKHHEADFYVVPQYYMIVEKKAADFDKQVEQVKKCAKLLANPEAGLKSKEADERLQTAAMLITQYRTPKQTANNQPPKTAAIDAAQSKLILEALAGGDWTRRGFDQVSPLALFFQLGVTDKDGWKPPQKGQEIGAAAQKWCKDNAGKYVIQRFVAEKAAK